MNILDRMRGINPNQPGKPPLPPRKGQLIQRQLQKNDPYADLSKYPVSEKSSNSQKTVNKTTQALGSILSILGSSLFSGTITNVRSVYQKMRTACSIINLEKFSYFNLKYFTSRNTIVDLCKKTIPQLPQITQLNNQYITCVPLTASDFASKLNLDSYSDLPEICLNMVKGALTSISAEDAKALTLEADMASSVLPLMTILTITNLFEKIITDRIKSNNTAINLAIGAGLTALVSLPFSVSLEAPLLAYAVYKSIHPLLHKTTNAISKRFLSENADCSVIARNSESDSVIEH